MHTTINSGTYECEQSDPAYDSRVRRNPVNAPVFLSSVSAASANLASHGRSPRMSVPSRDSTNKKLLACFASAVGISAIMFAASGMAAADVQPLKKAGHAIVTGKASAPMAASSVIPYEQKVSFSDWADAYEDEKHMAEELENKVSEDIVSNSRFVSDDNEKRVAELSADIADSTDISEVKAAYIELDALSDVIDEEISNGISAEQKAAERERRRSLVTDTLNPDEWSDEKLEFVVSWGERVDAYLSRWPLAGYGQNFAAAAYDNDIDPRIGAAISVIESGGGTSMFRSYNCWGWGDSSWSSFEEAIEEWSAAFQHGYGYDMDYADCRAYCPPNAGYYEKLRGQMEQILYSEGNG